MEKDYPKESAGRRMVSNVPLCRPDDNVAEIKKKIFLEAPNWETINYIYVVKGKTLIGVFSLKEVFRRKDNEKASSFMDKKVVKIRPHADQEKAAFLAIKHNIKAVPVVGRDDLFLGVVASDTILDILHEEHVEDSLISAGLHKENGFSIIDAPVLALIKMKLPWLIVGLFGGVLAAQLTSFFEAPLKSHFMLAAFIPLIVYMSAAVGSQTQTIFVRSLAVSNFSQKKYFIKEIKTGFFISLILSLIIFLVSWLISQDLLVSSIISISLFLTIMSAIVISFLISLFLFKTGKDPALGSGPFGTIVSDISSLLIYFVVAIVLLGLFSSLH